MKKPFYGWLVTAAAICTFGIAVGIPYYNMPFFYDYYKKAPALGGFGWATKDVTLGFPLAALLTLWVGPVLVPRFSPRKLIMAGTALWLIATRAEAVSARNSRSNLPRSAACATSTAWAKLAPEWAWASG